MKAYVMHFTSHDGKDNIITSTDKAQFDTNVNRIVKYGDWTKLTIDIREFELPNK